MKDLEGKKAVVFGVLTKDSIAWGVAKKLGEYGCEVVVTCKDKFMSTLIPKFDKNFVPKEVLLCDVNNSDQVSDTFKHLEKQWGEIDILVHSIAYAPTEALGKAVHEVGRESFLETMNTSVYSFLEVSNHAQKLMQKNGGSIIAMTYKGSNSVSMGYGIMGPAKAALESSIKYLASDLGHFKIRVNGISAGPIKTAATSVFAGFDEILSDNANRAPLHDNISTENVGDMAAFLSSDLAKFVTGGIHFVDSGTQILGN